MIDASLPKIAAPRGPLARLMRRKLALFGLALIVLTVGAAIAAPWLTSYAPQEQMFDGLTLEGHPCRPGMPLFWEPICWAAICSAASFTVRGPP